jgi:hypothetical protein
MDTTYQAGHDGDHFLRIDWLSYVHLKAGGQRPHPVFGAGAGRDSYGRN